jgi:hypothetical protein
MVRPCSALKRLEEKGNNKVRLYLVHSSGTPRDLITLKLTWEGINGSCYITLSLFCSDHHGAPVLCAGEAGGEEEMINTLQVDSAGPHVFLRSLTLRGVIKGSGYA